MNKKRFQEISIEYFHETRTFSELVSILEKEIFFQVEKIALPANERVMLIANHPVVSREMNLPAEKIAGCKGGNSFNFPDFWFPILRQIMLQKALGRRSFTIAHDIGWKVAMQEMGHLLIRANGKGRCQEIISLMREDDSSLVIFPEGGARDLQVFHSGFFYIACELGIRYVVLGVFSPVLSLEGKNFFRVVQIENLSRLIDPVMQFVEAQRICIKKALEI